VIVVRPSTKREKKKKKRLADPTRRSYNHILELSEQRGSHIFSAPSSRNSSVAKLPDEEAAVAAALGLPQSYTASRTSLSTSERSSVSQEGPMTPMVDSLDSINKSLARDLSISSDETKLDSASLTLAEAEPHDGRLQEDVSPAPSPAEEIPSSDDATPEPSSPETRIPVIVTDDVPADPRGKRRSL
jgi:hypothetical protein